MPIVVSHEPARPLSGPEKVAALLLALDREAAQRVLKHFSHDDLLRLAKHAAKLGNVGAPVIEPLIAELIEQVSGSGPDLVGGASKAEQLLTGVIPAEAVAEIMSDVLGSSNQFLWQRLSTIPDAVFAGYLSGEHPQTIAVILGKIDAALAAKLITQLDGHLRNSVMRRMLVSRPVSDVALRIIEATLQQDLLGSRTVGAEAAVKARVAGIINQMEREQVEDVLQTIEASEPVLAQQLKNLLFSFEDIPKLSERARAILFDQVATETLILALRGAEEAIKAAILPALGARTRRMVEAELSSSDSRPPPRDILRAQRLIAETVLKLSEQGTIEMDTATAEGAG